MPSPGQPHPRRLGPDRRRLCPGLRLPPDAPLHRRIPGPRISSRWRCHVASRHQVWRVPGTGHVLLDLPTKRGSCTCPVRRRDPHSCVSVGAGTAGQLSDCGRGADPLLYAPGRGFAVCRSGNESLILGYCHTGMVKILNRGRTGSLFCQIKHIKL